ncbi:hypothetical protein B0H11DRAFT_230884 [Mycena galericulata]|nr:hypothetical protein B0H11DRAFT_230884 [Mycena galericulata]
MIQSARLFCPPPSLLSCAAARPVTPTFHSPAETIFSVRLNACAVYYSAETRFGGYRPGRFYLISVVSFYAALGIVDRPFYGLVTSGDRGAILMAWKSKPESESAKRAEIYIMERNVCRMDISNPLEAFQFATFLIRLREDQNELKKLVEEKLGGDLDVEKLARWRKLAQPRLIPVKEKEEEDSAQGQTAPATTPTTRLILTPLPEVGESPT